MPPPSAVRNLLPPSRWWPPPANAPHGSSWERLCPLVRRDRDVETGWAKSGHAVRRGLRTPAAQSPQKTKPHHSLTHGLLSAKGASASHHSVMQSSNRPVMNRHERPARQQYLASGHGGKNPQSHVVDSESNHEQLSTEKPSSHGRRTVSIMGYNAWQYCRQGAIGRPVVVRRRRFPTGWAQVMPPSPRPTMKK